MQYNEPAAAALVADTERLASVRASALLGTAREDVFDRLTRLASKLTGAPVAFFSVVDVDHDYFKSCSSDEPELEAIRRVEGRSFCHYAMLGEGPLVVNDALQDPVLRSLPSVVHLGVAAYLGTPLRLADGHAIGAFCVADRKPHAWTQRDIEVITELGEAAVRELHLRSALAEVKGSIKERNELLSLIASDLRNPVTIMALCADLLSETELSTPQRELVERMHKATGRMEEGLRTALGLTDLIGGAKFPEA